MGTDRPLRVGVFGVGSLGQWHARIFSELAETELRGVFDADADRAREIAARYGTRAFESTEALAAEVEAASVVVPTDLHTSVAVPLLQRGLHLLIEKPLAPTAAEAEALAAEADRAGVCLQVGHVERFNPATAWLEAEIDAPFLIEARRLAPYPPARPPLRPRGTEVSVVLDLMIHDLELILHLVRDPVVETQATGAAVLSPEEDVAAARVRFANGCVAQVTASRLSGGRERRMEVYQPDGCLAVDFQDQSGRRTRRREGVMEETVAPIEKGEPLLLQLRAFAESVRRGQPPAVDGRRAVAALRLAEAIRRRIAEGGA